jgi:kinesin family protein C1
MSQITVQSQPTPRRDEDLDLVEEADLRSRVREMQQRVEQLEREKMVLSMANAPLEARYRQKEDNWAKEQNRLLQEIESLKNASREADENYRDLEMKHELALEECRQLREACRKASSLRPVEAAETSTWSRRLQTDRDVADLTEKLRHAEDEMKDIRLVKVSVEKELNATKIEFDSLLRSYDELQVEYEEIASSKSASRDAEIKLEHLTTEHIATSAQLNAVCADLAATKARAEAGMRAKDDEYKREIAQLQFEMSVLKTRAGRAELNQRIATGEDVEDEAVLRARIEERDRRIAELQAELLKGEQIRRQMHNRIQELRGNIRVFVRTRPFLPADGHSMQSSIDVLPDGESLSIIDSRNSNPHAFKFDKVFPPSAGQDMVFSEVSDFVQSALDGYHVCLFSYGQTGSGKTHTMQGSGNGVMRGIIPRAVEQVLSQAHALQKQSWEFQMSASFLEIYNEDLRDLLISMNGPSSHTKNASKLSIKRNAEGKSYVEGLTEIPIETVDSDAGLKRLDALMAVAARSRSTASTKMNSQSSRSHSVFMLHLRGYNAESGTTVDGALNLCDLAGSERLDRSGAGSDAQRLRETQAINKSLSCLGDVFNALATGASHVPYRNSKLTYLLQDCLSGDGKALMFVNLSPTVASSNESLCSLRFAQRVNQVELGKPTKHIQYTKHGSNISR